MAYVAGDTILDDEYNTFVNSSSSPFGINHIGGTGSAQYGLGESSVATVCATCLLSKNSGWKRSFLFTSKRPSITMATIKKTQGFIIWTTWKKWIAYILDT